MRRLIYIPLTVAVVAIILGMAQTVEAEETFLVHLKTGLKKDDAQIKCMIACLYQFPI